MKLASAIKTQLLVNLQALKAAGAISSFVSLDKNPNPLEDVPAGGYPFAIVGMPRIASEFEDTATNLRTYRFDILFVLNLNELTNPDTDVEDMIDAALNQFDSNFTLAGVADAAVLPAKIEAVPVTAGDKTLICVVLTLECRKLYQVGS